MVRYFISVDKNIIIEKFMSEVNFELIERASLDIWANPNYDKTYKALRDIRNCSVNIGYKDIPKLANFFLKNSKSAIGYVVILANSNQSIAKSLLFRNNVLKLLNTHVMSDFDEALRSLKIEPEFYQIINSNQATVICNDADLRRNKS